MLDYWEGEARADALKGLWKRIRETYPEAQQKPRPPSWSTPKEVAD
jgi:hypothetical protein